MQERGQQVLERKETAGAGRGGHWGASEDHWAARATSGTSGLETQAVEMAQRGSLCPAGLDKEQNPAGGIQRRRGGGEAGDRRHRCPGGPWGDVGSPSCITALGGRQETPPASSNGRRLPRIPQTADRRLQTGWQSCLSRPLHKQSPG